jgi:glutamate N-acetyltransferase/amino-acid N-acetyltransferase
VNLDFDRMDLFLGDIEVIKKGKITDPLWEKKVRTYFKKKEIKINLNLNLGKYETSALTTDLTYEYIRINASYRT